VFTLISAYRNKKESELIMTTLHTFTPVYKATHRGSARLDRTATYLSRLANKASAAVAASYATWQAHRAAVLADEKMWAFAHQDPRLMAEINAAMLSRN
jgi:predicted N-formylglutamate amidohydrolase